MRRLWLCAACWLVVNQVGVFGQPLPPNNAGPAFAAGPNLPSGGPPDSYNPMLAGAPGVGPAPVAPNGSAALPAAPVMQPAIPPAPVPAASNVPGAAPTPPGIPAAPATGTPAAADSPQFFSLDELNLEMKKLVWRKGDFSVTPYGTLWTNMVLEDGRTTPGNYPMYVSRPRVDANDDCYIDARSTRLGIDVLGPRIPLLGNAQSGGKVEIDFQRQIDTENKPSVLLRHAYVEVKNDDFRLLAGQTWDVISPLMPGVLFYSVGWDAGNIGYRRPQFRGEGYCAMSDTFQFIAQGSLNAVAPADTTGTATTYNAVAAGWPILEGRLATRIGPRGEGCLPWEFGVSSHVGEFIYDFHRNTAAPGQTPNSPFAFDATGTPRRTWSLGADLRIPITHSFGVQGEYFIGENLGPFLGGIGQSVDIVSYTAGGVYHPASGDSIHSQGGWVDVWYDWTPRLHTHTGYSIDDPVNQDVTSGRVYNAFYFANVSYDLTAKFLVGFEYSRWKTLWVGPSVDANSDNYNFVVKYSF
jgi:hypothetical protein